MARGDEAGLAELYDRLAPLAYGLARAILRDEHWAQEVVQEGFLQVWNRVRDFDPARGTVRAWLLRIIRNLAIDRRRAELSRLGAVARAGRENVPAEASLSGFDLVATRQDRETLGGALAALSAEQRRAVELAYLEGLTHTEIADREGLPLGTVKSRIRDGVLRLRSNLPGDGDG